MLPKKPPVLIQLGRYGDLLLLFPAFKLIYDRIKLKPVIIVSNQYADIFDGISYAIPHPITGHWFLDMPKARKVAEEIYGEAVVPAWWNDSILPKDVPKGPMILQCHGEKWDCNPRIWPDYMTSMWMRAGFTREDMISTPLVIDRRNPKREETLISQYIKEDKPTLLFNFTGFSSPFPYVPEMMHVFSEYRNHFSFVDLGNVHALRIYDLLGLYEKAIGLITSDTATLHLANASPIPTVMFLVPGWSHSTPRGNCKFSCYYPQVPLNWPKIKSVIESWIANKKSCFCPLP